MCSNCVYMANDDPTHTIPLRGRYAKDYSDRWGTVSDELTGALGGYAAGYVGDEQMLASINSSVERNLLADNWEWVYSDQSYIAGSRQASIKLGPTFPTLSAIQILQAPTNQQAISDSRALNASSKIKNAEQTSKAMMTAASAALTESMGNTLDEKVEAIAKAIQHQANATGIVRSKAASSSLVVQTHSTSTLNTFEVAGIVSVSANIEMQFTTAGDSRVCAECQSLAGGTYTLEEARGVIPVHISCRCSWNPRLRIRR